mgnify:CR=1 FL=1
MLLQLLAEWQGIILLFSEVAQETCTSFWCDVKRRERSKSIWSAHHIREQIGVFRKQIRATNLCLRDRL